MVTLVVTKGSASYRVACPSLGIQDGGETVSEAIGNLVRNNAGRLGINIEGLDDSSDFQDPHRGTSCGFRVVAQI
jgi:hypothetical protein